MPSSKKPRTRLGLKRRDDDTHPGRHVVDDGGRLGAAKLVPETLHLLSSVLFKICGRNASELVDGRNCALSA